MQHATTGNNETARSQLVHLDDMDGYKVADGDPDVRGWTVRTADGLSAGRVDGLVVDADALRVEYLDVELDRKNLSLQDDRHVLVPLSAAKLDDDHDDVLLGTLTAPQLAELQPYQHGQPIVPSTPARVRDSDVQNFYGKRGGTGAVRR